jgi:hypothetical protein
VFFRTLFACASWLLSVRGRTWPAMEGFWWRPAPSRRCAHTAPAWCRKATPSIWTLCGCMPSGVASFVRVGGGGVPMHGESRTAAHEIRRLTVTVFTTLVADRVCAVSTQYSTAVRERSGQRGSGTVPRSRGDLIVLAAGFSHRYKCEEWSFEAPLPAWAPIEPAFKPEHSAQLTGSTQL